MKESDLFLPIKQFLLESGCSDVYGEVLSCDVLGLNGSCNMVVELKTSLTFKLIDQAMERLRIGHYVYIAIPKRKTPLPKSAKKLLEIHRIGLLEVNKNKVNVVIPAKYNRLKSKNNIRKYIRDYNKEQIGGVKEGERVTDYSVTMDRIKDFLEYRKRGKWVTVDEILEHCETHYVNPKPSLMATLQKKWNEDWCETKLENRKRYFRYRKTNNK